MYDIIFPFIHYHIDNYIHYTYYTDVLFIYNDITQYIVRLYIFFYV